MNAIRRLGVASLVALTAALALPTSRASAAPYTVPAFVQGLKATFGHPEASPPGANDWKCKPSAAHPRPVVFVHGTFGNMSDNGSYVVPQLKAHGYCVFALNYGGPPAFNYMYGVGPIRDSAKQLGDFVDKVLLATEATQVDLIGHSQGGMMPRWYMKFLDGAAKVHTLIGLSPSNHGTSLGAQNNGSPSKPNAFEQKYCQACIDQSASSEFMHQLNDGGDTVSGVEYTVIETMYDEVVTPYQSAFLSGPNVHNFTLQDVCPLDFSEHLGTAFDPVAMRLALNALDPSHAIAPTCGVVLGVLTT